MRKNSKKKKIAYAFIAPAIISILVFTVVPIIYTVFISFTNYNMYHLEDFNMVGIANYLEVIRGSISKVFFPVLGWTLVFAAISTMGAYLIGMGMAVLLNNPRMREAKIYKSLLIVPWALPATIAILAWQGLLNEQYGGINNLLHIFGIPGIPWMTNVFWARVGIIMVESLAGISVYAECVSGRSAVHRFNFL